MLDKEYYLRHAVDSLKVDILPMVFESILTIDSYMLHHQHQKLISRKVSNQFIGMEAIMRNGRRCISCLLYDVR